MEKSTKEIAQRIDPGYFGRPHPMRTWRRRANWAAFGVALAWAAVITAGDEGALSAGPVSSRHASWDQECSVCHVERFESVPQAACLSCHKVEPHVDADADPHCVACHTEHRGRVSLAVVADAQCNVCHEDHGGIRDFEGHPGFEIAPPDQGLVFNHAAHLSPDLVDGPLSCASCHTADATGRGFAPIRYEAHCARCHTLGLDPDLPDQRVPHGFQPDALEPLLASAYLGADKKVVELLRKKPAATLEAALRNERVLKSDLARLQKRTRGALRRLLPEGGSSGCFLCHVGDREEIVVPDVPTRYLHRARFDHEAHRFTECSSCHTGIARSRDADDVDIPSLESCRDCHKPEGARQTCTACHPYHPPAVSGR